MLFKQDGEFVRTIQMRNLTCALRFDPRGEPWLADGMDGQVLKIHREGNVLGAIGGGQGKKGPVHGEQSTSPGTRTVTFILVTQFYHASPNCCAEE